jgi:hypothetical protein
MLIYRAMDYSGFKTIYLTYVPVCIRSLIGFQLVMLNENLSLCDGHN